MMAASKEELSAIDDIGDIVASDIFGYFSEKRDFINKLLSKGIKIVSTKKSEGIFSGEYVVLTGTLSSMTRGKASEIIEAQGGKVQSSVTKETTLVVAGENAGSKLAKAQATGKKIINESEFLSLINA